MQKYTCYVCGYDKLDEEPRSSIGVPSFDICECCGIEFGYEDCTETNIVTYRNHWIASGGKWFDESKKPLNWDMYIQLTNIT